MIAYLSGKPLVGETFTAVLCNGVGYGVNITAGTKQKMIGSEQIDLFIYSHIKEDAFDLYGFLTEAEKALFLKLIDVDGVGPKTALGIMDRGVTEIIHAVREADVSFFQGVPRVGKKSAQKIIIELKSKLGGEDLTLTEPQGKAKEVIEALTSLGFGESESQKVVAAMDIEPMRIEDAVKESIKKLTREIMV